VQQLKEKIIGERIIEVNCSDSAPVLKALKGMKGIEACINSPRIVHVSVDSYKKMKDIMSALSGSSSEIYNITALEPSLEETYLTIMNNKPKEKKGLCGHRKTVAGGEEHA
jgi:hypothetical protein